MTLGRRRTLPELRSSRFDHLARCRRTSFCPRRSAEARFGTRDRPGSAPGRSSANGADGDVSGIPDLVGDGDGEPTARRRVARRPSPGSPAPPRRGNAASARRSSPGARRRLGLLLARRRLGGCLRGDGLGLGDGCRDGLGDACRHRLRLVGLGQSPRPPRGSPPPPRRAWQAGAAKAAPSRMGSGGVGSKRTCSGRIGSAVDPASVRTSTAFELPEVPGPRVVGEQGHGVLGGQAPRVLSPRSRHQAPRRSRCEKALDRPRVSRRRGGIADREARSKADGELTDRAGGRDPTRPDSPAVAMKRRRSVSRTGCGRRGERRSSGCSSRWRASRAQTIHLLEAEGEQAERPRSRRLLGAALDRALHVVAAEITRALTVERALKDAARGGSPEGVDVAGQQPAIYRSPVSPTDERAGCLRASGSTERSSSGQLEAPRSSELKRSESASRVAHLPLGEGVHADACDRPAGPRGSAFPQLRRASGGIRRGTSSGQRVEEGSGHLFAVGGIAEQDPAWCPRCRLREAVGELELVPPGLPRGPSARRSGGGQRRRRWESVGAPRMERGPRHRRQTGEGCRGSRESRCTIQTAGHRAMQVDNVRIDVSVYRTAYREMRNPLCQSGPRAQRIRSSDPSTFAHSQRKPSGHAETNARTRGESPAVHSRGQNGKNFALDGLGFASLSTAAQSPGCSPLDSVGGCAARCRCSRREGLPE